MEPCAHCPLGPTCPAVTVGHVRYCRTVDPASPDYQRGMREAMRGEPPPPLDDPPVTAEAEAAAGLPVRTLVCADASDYLGWQTIALARSFRAVGQAGTLTRLVAATEREATPYAREAFDLGVQTVRTGRYRDAEGIADYPPANKPGALAEWLRATPPADEVLHVVDPDTAYLRPLAVDVDLGRPAAEFAEYLDASARDHAAVLARHSAIDPALVQPIGVPLLIHRGDLEVFADRWRDLTFALRRDPVAVAAWGWVCEMWACAIAAAEAGIRFRIGRWQQHPGDEDLGRELAHYTYDVLGPGGYRWSKRGYRAWERIAEPPPGTKATGRLIWAHVDGTAAAFARPDLATVLRTQKAVAACRVRQTDGCGCGGKALCFRAGTPRRVYHDDCRACRSGA